MSNSEILMCPNIQEELTYRISERKLSFLRAQKTSILQSSFGLYSSTFPNQKKKKKITFVRITFHCVKVLSSSGNIKHNLN